MKIVMMGTGTFAEPTFQALLDGSHRIVGLVTQPDRASGHERGSTRQTGKGLKAMAQERGVPVLQPESVNTPEGVAGVQAFGPDLLVVAAYGQILSQEVLGVAPHGGINVHASLLPRYRGAAPVAWAIARGEQQTGVTIIRMSVGLDSGDMLIQEAVDIGPDETAGELEARLAPLGARLALGVIDRIAAGTVQGVKQDKAAVTKAPKLKKEDGLIDWSHYSRDVYNHIRAMQPWPTAYTYLHRAGQKPLRIIVHKSSWNHGRQHGFTPPGQVICRPQHEHELHVATGVAPGTTWPSEVEILELQPAGKRRMTVRDFLRGHPLKPDDRFGAETP